MTPIEAERAKLRDLLAGSDWKARLVDERDELKAKLQKLSSFLTEGGKALPTLDILDLVDQQTAMKRYLEILDRRIAKLVVVP